MHPAALACLVALAAAPAAVAATPVSPPALRIDGATPGAQTGSSVAGAGDVNGDGHADIVIEGRRRAVTDAFGWSVDGAGDVDGDGLDDVVIAAPGNPGFEERVQRGAAYVVYGRRLGGTVRVRRLRHRGFRIASADPGGLRSVAGAGDVDGDVNGDGLPDLIVGAPQGNRTPFNTAGGGAFVVFGRRAPRERRSPRAGQPGIEIRGSGIRLGGLRGRVGGARRRRPARRRGAARARLPRRRLRTAVGGDRPAGPPRPAAGYLIDGTIEPNQWYSDSASGGFITAAAVGGDADGDGTDDVLAGVRMADHDDRPDSGSAYLFFGRRAMTPPAAGREWHAQSGEDALEALESSCDRPERGRGAGAPGRPRAEPVAADGGAVGRRPAPRPGAQPADVRAPAVGRGRAPRSGRSRTPRSCWPSSSSTR